MTKNQEEIKVRTMAWWHMSKVEYEKKVTQLIESGAIDCDEWIKEGAALPRTLAVVAFEHVRDSVRPVGKAKALLSNLRHF